MSWEANNSCNHWVKHTRMRLSRMVSVACFPGGRKRTLRELRRALSRMTARDERGSNATLRRRGGRSESIIPEWYGRKHVPFFMPLHQHTSPLKPSIYTSLPYLSNFYIHLPSFSISPSSHPLISISSPSIHTHTHTYTMKTKDQFDSCTDLEGIQQLKLY